MPELHFKLRGWQAVMVPLTAMPKPVTFSSKRASCQTAGATGTSRALSATT